MPRLEKHPRMLDESGYQTMLALLKDAQAAAEDHWLRVVPEEGENLNQLANQLKWTAKRAELKVLIRRHSQLGYLSLWFPKPAASGRTPTKRKRSPQQRLWSYLTPTPQSLAELARQSGLKPGLIRTILKKLVEAGRVACLDDGVTLHAKRIEG